MTHFPTLLHLQQLAQKMTQEELMKTKGEKKEVDDKKEEQLPKESEEVDLHKLKQASGIEIIYTPWSHISSVGRMGHDDSHEDARK